MDEKSHAEGDITWFALGKSPIKRAKQAVYDLIYHDCLGSRISKVGIEGSVHEEASRGIPEDRKEVRP